MGITLPDLDMQQGEQTNHYAFFQRFRQVWGRMIARPTSVSVTDYPYEAVGDGVADDTQAIRDAISDVGAGGVVQIPYDARCRVTGPLHITQDHVTIIGPGTLFYDFLTDDLFHVTGSYCTFDAVKFDGRGAAGDPANVSLRAIYANGAPNITVKNCHFTDLTRTVDDYPYPHNPPHTNGYVQHAIYLADCDNAVVQNNWVYSNVTIDPLTLNGISLSGCFCFVHSSDNVQVLNNHVNDARWYYVQGQKDINGITIRDNVFTGLHPKCRGWGCSVQIQSESANPVTHILIDNNYISGVHAYHQAIAVEGSHAISITNNSIENMIDSSGYGGSFVYHINCAYHATFEKACEMVIISGNKCTANQTDGTSVQSGIKITNYSVDVGALKNLIITHNILRSPKIGAYLREDTAFQCGIYVEGAAGGAERVIIDGNEIECFPSALVPGGAAICVSSSHDGLVKDVTLAHNKMNLVTDTAVPGSAQLGVLLYATNGAAKDTVTNVDIHGNHIHGFYDPIYGTLHVSAVDIGQNDMDAGHTADTATFTADHTTDTLTHASDGIDTCTRVRLTTTNTLPAGLSLLTDYWTIWQSATTSKLAASYEDAVAGNAVPFSDNGVGTHTLNGIHQLLTNMVVPARRIKMFFKNVWLPGGWTNVPVPDHLIDGSYRYTSGGLLCRGALAGDHVSVAPAAGLGGGEVYFPAMAGYVYTTDVVTLNYLDPADTLRTPQTYVNLIVER